MGRRAVFSELYDKMRKQLGLGEDDASDLKVRCTYCTRKVRVVDFDDLHPGDHISMGGEHCKFNFNDNQVTLYKHHAIVKKIEKVNNQTSCTATLIHFYSLSFDDDIKIRETTLILDLGKHDVFKVRYSHSTNSPEKIIERAELLVKSGESYNPVTCNCEHFCHWCCIGESESFQVNEILDVLRQIGTGAVTVSGKVCKTIATMIVANSTLKGVSCICVPWGVLSIFAIGYLIFCIYRHRCLDKETSCDKMCSRCCRHRKMELWSRFFLYCVTQAGGVGLLSVVIAAGASTGIVGGCLIVVSILSIALMVGIPKLKKKLAPPFKGQTLQVDKLENIWIGDSISFKYKMMMHDGIVSKVETLTPKMANVSVIHYSLPCVFGRRVVQEETLHVDLTNDTILQHDYADYTCHPPEIVVQRARQRLGETKYGVFSNRSCHFCYWAKVNEDVEDAPIDNHEPVPKLRFKRSLTMGEPIDGMEQINADHSINRQHSTKTMGLTWARIPQEVKEGSVIQFKYGPLRSWHFAVTTEVEYPEEPSSLLIVTVVHYGNGNRPCEEKFRFDLRYDDVWIHKYHPLYRYNTSEVIRRARARIDDGQYNVLRYKSSNLAKDIVRKNARDELVTNFDAIQAGDVIIFYYWSLKHAAIVVEIADSFSKANNSTLVTIIHYALETLFSKRTIKHEAITMDLSRDHVYRRNYEELTYPPHRVISRAKSRLDEKRFNASGNTSWDLVHWAKVVQTPALVDKAFDDESCGDTGENIVVLPHVTMVNDHHFQRVPVYAWLDLQPGIIIEYRYYWIWHQAILADVDPATKKITVIHYGTNTIFSTRTIMKDTFNIDLSRNKLWMYRCDPNRCNPPGEIMTLAYGRLGEQKWGRKNTTWDFCKACVLKKQTCSVERKN